MTRLRPRPTILVMALNDPLRVVAALEATQWVVAHAARRLKCSRQALYDALRRYGIERLETPPDVYSDLMSRNGRRGGRPRERTA